MFAGRSSMGVRGISLEEGDKVISMSILRHVEATADERAAYLKRANAVRRGDEEDRSSRRGGRTPRRRQRRDRARRAALCRDVGGRAVRADRLREGHGQALVVLRVPDHQSRRQRHRRDGHPRRQEGREDHPQKTGKLVASFPVEESDQIMLVTDGGQLIRTRSKAFASSAARRRA